jgi:hydroxylamine dehydrogenase
MFMKLLPVAVCVSLVLGILAFSGGNGMAAEEDESNCVKCHRTVTPGHVTDWETSTHAEMGIDCSVCHGAEHQSVKNSQLARLPDESVCGDCHYDQFEQFKKGKHSHGWKSLNAMPVKHLEPDELMEGARGCGGCHNMGIKSDKEKQALRAKGYRYQNNSCDECHTRHTFAKSEAQDPRACQQCHMGYDHPQWEMWSSAKHGTRWFTKDQGCLPKNATAPRCQDCHLPNGTHTNRTAWGFFGVRLPLSKNKNDKQWTEDRSTILKALGVLNPKTGEPTSRLDVIKELDMARLTEEDWQNERNKMIQTCAKCHSKAYGATQLKAGDDMMKKADHLMAQAIHIVAALYEEGIIEKPVEYEYAYPDFWYFMRTNGTSMDHLSHIDQVLFEMYMKHRMRTYQGCYHVNPDYAYWYGWAMMTKDLGEIQELDHLLRKAHEEKK